VVTLTTDAVQVRVAVHDDDLAAARGLEHDVFVAEGFIAHSERRIVEDYTDLDAQSRWYLAERDGDIIGVLRLIEPGPSLLPAVRHFALTREFRAELDRQRYAEVGTLAVAEAYRGTDTGLHLYRAAFEDSVRAGFTAWVSVLERWLLQHLGSFGFPFEPMGETRYYMGGDCLPALMTFEDVLATLLRTDPGLHAWMTGGLTAAPAR
jgi:predicted GNAT family N-acyltransferase